MKNYNLGKNFIVIQGWMLSDLDLSGNELLTYAFIYGLTQWNDDKQNETCSFSFELLSQILKISKRAAINLVERLEQKGYIERFNTNLKDEKITRNKYKILCVSSEERTLLSGEESSLPKEYKKEYKKEIKNKENNNKEILENTKISQLSKQELKELQEIYKAKLKVISDKLKIVAKYNWVDDD